MDIQDFLQLCVGQWFSQRSSYHFEAQKAESHKAELAIEWLEKDHALVTSLCQENKIDRNTAIGGQTVSWNNSVDWGKPKQTGTATLIIIPNVDTPQIGKFLQKIQSQPATKGSYDLGIDEALTLTLDKEDFVIEERVWFASPNLRLRTTLAKSKNGYSQTAFYSEIKKVPPQKAA